MNEMSKICIPAITIALMLFSCPSLSEEELILKDDKSIAIAINLNDALDKFLANVHSCIEKKKKKENVCTCKTRQICPYKVEFDLFINMLCKSVKQYPSWKYSYIGFTNKKNLKGYSLGVKYMYSLYGNNCK